MKLLSLLHVISPALAWDDQGHLMVAEIAKLHLSKEEVAVIDGILGQWDEMFPGTSDLPTAAVWPDKLKCKDAGPGCYSEPIALSAFNAWHYSDIPFNPQHQELDLKPDAYMTNPSVIWLLGEALQTFHLSKSVFALNFVLRFSIHAVGDMHSLLHSTAGYFKNSKRFGTINGDQGGNLIELSTAWEDAGVDDLHHVFDSVCGEYTLFWPLSANDMAKLEENASDLVKQFPKSSFPTYSSDDLASCRGDSCRTQFGRWEDEVHQLAIDNAYGMQGIAVHAALPEADLARCRVTAKKQLVLAGYRLADYLKKVLPRLAEVPLSNLKAPPTGLTEAAAASGVSFAALPSMRYLDLDSAMWTIGALSCSLLLVLAFLARSLKQVALLRKRIRNEAHDLLATSSECE
mmetsp:Transcript_60943/g.108272  ORF Transcript_60943/g.108272 Transcript_60943/m.108272 type:complete len:403 (+) Transcript_60943:22-1230(+)